VLIRCSNFDNGRTDVDDKQRLGYVQELDILLDSVMVTVRKQLPYRKVCTPWVPQNLRDDHKPQYEISSPASDTISPAHRTISAVHCYSEWNLCLSCDTWNQQKHLWYGSTHLLTQKKKFKWYYKQGISQQMYSITIMLYLLWISISVVTLTAEQFCGIMAGQGTAQQVVCCQPDLWLVTVSTNWRNGWALGLQLQLPLGVKDK
jgi:hypothetical protein